MTGIPKTGAPDSTIALVREGYAFFTRRCRALGSDAFRTRIMLRPVVCAQGPEAAQVFYAPGRFTRRRAMPVTTVKLLQDFGSVQLLDGAAHAHRKALFMGLMTDEALARMTAIAGEEWRAAAARWRPGERLRLIEAAELVLCRAAMRWSGLDPDAHDAPARARAYGAMIRGAGMRGPLAWARGERLRTRNERWARAVIADIRAGRLAAPPDRAARAIALHRDTEGRLLPVKVAAVELLNILRPVTAVALFVTHAAIALHRNPAWRERLADPQSVRPFVREVRRLSPFFPAVGGRVLQPFRWRGHEFRRGEWMILDLWGTNRDPRAWAEPERFDPDRFAGREPTPFDLVPQGGGGFDGHRCAGEWLTIALVEQATAFLARELDYSVPEQDLTLRLSQIPSVPPDGFLIQPRGLARLTPDGRPGRRALAKSPSG